MPIKIVGSSSFITENKIDAGLIAQKPHLRTIYLESKIEEDNDMKNQFKLKNLHCAIENSDAV